MRQSLIIASLVLALPLAAQPAAKSASADPLAHAIEILKGTPLVDGHNDLPWAIRENKAAPRDVDAYDLRKQTPHQTDIARMRAGHVGGSI